MMLPFSSNVALQGRRWASDLITYPNMVQLQERNSTFELSIAKKMMNKLSTYFSPKTIARVTFAAERGQAVRRHFRVSTLSGLLISRK